MISIMEIGERTTSQDGTAPMNDWPMWSSLGYWSIHTTTKGMERTDCVPNEKVED